MITQFDGPLCLVWCLVDGVDVLADECAAQHLLLVAVDAEVVGDHEAGQQSRASQLLQRGLAGRVITTEQY